MNNFASICFGGNMGVAIYSPACCRLLKSGDMIQFKEPEWTRRLTMMRDKWQIDLAIIQCWGDIPRISEPHLAAVKSVYPNHLLIHHDQWNPVRMSRDRRRDVAEALLVRKISRPEHVDAILCGKWIFDILRSSGAPFPAAYLEELATTTRRFPRRQDLRMLQGRRLSEVANA